MLAGLDAELEQIPPWSLVTVRWKDAFDGPLGWTDVSTYKVAQSHAIIITIGFYWEKCLDGYLTLASSISESELPNCEEVSNISHIPIEMIISIQR